MTDTPKGSLNNWAQFRFSIIGGLLARPPMKGELRKELQELASHTYQHPTKDKPVKFGVSTIERWYYKALQTNDPVGSLERKSRSDAGTHKAMSSELLKALGKQYKMYPSWSYKLHSDNIKVLSEERPELGEAPSYSTVTRRMKERNWYKKQSRRKKTKGQKQAALRLEKQEVRSFESSYPHGLWHLDFHHCSMRVIDIDGQWRTPIALCILDDYSRLCCHIQWFLNETAEVLQHGLTQAFHKRGLPRALMTDNGSAMVAGETKNGLMSLGIKHEKTLPYSPYQNGKQESFWGQLEGRLIAMLNRVDCLSLEQLNYSTQAWIEMEYNRSWHDEINTSPVQRVLSGKDVSRQSPDSEDLRFSFTVRETRAQRQSDGTLQINGVRFEIPSRFRHFKRLSVRYQNWDLSRAWLVNQVNGKQIATMHPQDKEKNNQGNRRTLAPLHQEPELSKKDIKEPYPPLMRKLLSEYAATGLPPAYIPMQENAVDPNALQEVGYER